MFKYSVNPFDETERQSFIGRHNGALFPFVGSPLLPTNTFTSVTSYFGRDNHQFEYKLRILSLSFFTFSSSVQGDNSDNNEYFSITDSKYIKVILSFMKFSNALKT